VVLNELALSAKGKLACNRTIFCACCALAVLEAWNRYLQDALSLLSNHFLLASFSFMKKSPFRVRDTPKNTSMRDTMGCIWQPKPEHQSRRITRAIIAQVEFSNRLHLRAMMKSVSVGLSGVWVAGMKDENVSATTITVLVVASWSKNAALHFVQ